MRLSIAGIAGCRPLAAFAAAVFLTLAPGLAGQAGAQQIKPLDVERDANGVDLLSGQVVTRLPTLSIPAAPELSFQRVGDLLPVLTGQIFAGVNDRSTYDVNGGGSTSDHFDCNPDTGHCISKRRNGATIVPMPNSGPVEPDGFANHGTFTYNEGASGRQIEFDRQNGPNTALTAASGFSFYPSNVHYPDGRTLTFSYERFTTPNGQVWRRPTQVSSSSGYVLTLTYQGNVYGQAGWSTVAQATISAIGNMSVPLARLTYSGDTIRDLGDREWTCTNCGNSLATPAATTDTSLRLSGETADTFQAQAQERVYSGSSQTRTNWVTRIANDGVETTYTYEPYRSADHPEVPSAQYFTRVTIAGPLGLSRTVNIHVGAPPIVRPRIESIVDSLQRTTSYVYDNDNRPIRVNRPDGSAETVIYDGLGNITERRRIARPGSGLADLVETASYSGSENCNVPACFRPAWTRDAMNRQTDYTWYPSGDMMTRLEPADASGQRRKTIYGWSGGRLTSEQTCMTDAAGTALTCGTAAAQVRTITYFGATPLPASETATDGAGSQSMTTTYEYDTAGRLLKADGPLPTSGDALYYRYDVFGRRTWEIGAADNAGRRTATRTVYRLSDDRPLYSESGMIANELATAFIAPPVRTDRAYDSHRNPVRETVSANGAAFAVVDRSFDLRGRPVCEARRMNEGFFGTAPADACQPLDEPATGSNGPDRISQNFYDTESRLLQVRRGVWTPLEQIYAAYGYDNVSDRRTSVTDANGNRAEMQYDGHGRQTYWLFPSTTQSGAANTGDNEFYTYDAAGNRTALRRRDGTTVVYQYDALNRVVTKSVPASATGAAAYGVFYGYDVGNRQTYARFGSPTGTGVLNVYDTLGRLVSTRNDTSGTARTLGYHYDPGGRRDRLYFPDTHFLAYAYDPAGRLTAIQPDGGPALTSFTYDAAAGRLAQRQSGGASQSYGYDPVSRPAGLTIAWPAGSQSWGFEYNPASQVTARSSSNAAFASNTAYDVNRPYVANGLNQYTEAGPATFLYDPNGNLKFDGTTAFAYDGENRLVAANGAHNVQMQYDPLGRLARTTGAAATTEFLYDGDELVAEYDATGTGPPPMLRRYVHGTGTDDPVASFDGPDLTRPRHLFTDHQGSIVAITDGAGSMLAVNAYDAWGIPNQSNAGTFGYTGQAWIPELGMWHYKARVYSPTLGRFLQTDPVGYDDQVNLYAYVGNDPVNFSDPNGECRAGAVAQGAYGRGETTIILCSDGFSEVRRGGSLAWRNNNPGNMQAGRFSERHGSIGRAGQTREGRFAVFPTVQAGAQALAALLHGPSYSSLTPAAAIEKYAPPEDNNTAAYQRSVRSQVGDTGDRTIGQMSSGEMGRIISTISREEGWIGGTVSYRATNDGALRISNSITGSRIERTVVCTPGEKGACTR